jgi:type I restriction enzyme S subunit
VSDTLEAPWTSPAPRSWQRTYLGHLVDVRSGATPAKDEPSFWDGEIPWVSPKDMKVLRIRDSEDHVSEAALSASALRWIAEGSVLMVTRGMILDHTVPIALAERPLTINQDMKALIPRGDLRGDFLMWMLVGLNPAILAQVEEAAHGTKALRTEQWRKLPLATPPHDVQRRIANFLDRKTASVDALVAKQEQLLALLAEKRQGLITQAVTKGLDPTVPMKHSGVDWIGDVPAHWRIQRVKHVARVESGHTPSRSVPDHWLESNDIPWVSLNDTKWLAAHDYITETAHYINELGLQNSSARLLPGRAVVFTRDATIGKAAITTRPMAVSQHIIAWLCGPTMDPEYLLRVFYAMEPVLEKYTFGATLRTIGMDDVRSLVTPVPPLGEQERIVEHVQSELRRLDGLAQRAEAMVEKLREYRQALITAAVTGQLDVASSAPSAHPFSHHAEAV